MLSHTSETGQAGEGGATQLVDGFRVSKELSKHDRDVLRTVKLFAHSSGNEGVSIRNEMPFSVLEYENDESFPWRIRWNNDDRAGFSRFDLEQGAEHIDKWYRAAARWHELINTRDCRWWFEHRLQPGQLLRKSTAFVPSILHGLIQA